MVRQDGLADGAVPRWVDSSVEVCRVGWWGPASRQIGRLRSPASARWARCRWPPSPGTGTGACSIASSRATASKNGNRFRLRPTRSWKILNGDGRAFSVEDRSKMAQAVSWNLSYNSIPSVRTREPVLAHWSVRSDLVEDGEGNVVLAGPTIRRSRRRGCPCAGAGPGPCDVRSASLPRVEASVAQRRR